MPAAKLSDAPVAAAPPDFDPVTARKALDVLAKVAAYHRLEVRGLENIPDGPCLLVGNHGGGLSIVDGLFLVRYYSRQGFDRPVYILVHDLAFRLLIGLRRFMPLVGLVRAAPRKARELLAHGHKVLVFPGADAEALRPFRDRKKVILAGRTGWARLALEAKVPVVPVVTAGDHETLVVLSQGRRLARLLRLRRWARLDSFPLLLCLPWGVLAGPTCALPYLPLPAKVTVQIGKPIWPSKARGSRKDPEAAARSLYLRMQDTMQSILDGLYAERRLPVLG